MRVELMYKRSELEFTCKEHNAVLTCQEHELRRPLFGRHAYYSCPICGGEHKISVRRLKRVSVYERNPKIENINPAPDASNVSEVTVDTTLDHEVNEFVARKEERSVAINSDFVNRFSEADMQRWLRGEEVEDRKASQELSESTGDKVTVTSRRISDEEAQETLKHNKFIHVS